MKRNIINIIVLLLSATAVLSCSAELMFPADSVPGNDYGSAGKLFPIRISGRVTDIDTGDALEDIRITIHANENGETFSTKNTYTDNRGEFTLDFRFENYATSFVAIADDLNGKYESSRHELLVSWNAIYNIDEGIFSIKCDFHLKKLE